MQKIKKATLLKRSIALLLVLFMFFSSPLNFLGGGASCTC